MNNYEFDKVVLSLALAIFTIVFCINIGDLIYYPEIEIKERGYEIEVTEVPSLAAGQEVEVDESNLDLKTLFAQVNYAAGEATFKKCAICHTMNKGEANKVGPNLWNIVNRPVASNPSFAYSAAMENKGKAGDVWSYQELVNYLKAPKKYVPGTKMAFAGIKNLQDRIDLIEFLRNHADAPINKP